LQLWWRPWGKEAAAIAADKADAAEEGCGAVEAGRREERS
jgi:hypothetical protein